MISLGLKKTWTHNRAAWIFFRAFVAKKLSEIRRDCGCEAIAAANKLHSASSKVLFVSKRNKANEAEITVLLWATLMLVRIMRTKACKQS